MAIFRQSADESRVSSCSSSVRVAVVVVVGVPRSVALNGERFAPK